MKAAPTANAQSHGGIFIRIDGIPLEGSGATAFAFLNIGEEASFYAIAIRRRLLDLAKKRMTMVEQLLNS